MLLYDKLNGFFELRTENFTLFAYTLPELRQQALNIYQFDISTILN